MRQLIVNPDPCFARLADALDLERGMDAHQRANDRRGVAQAGLREEGPERQKVVDRQSQRHAVAQFEAESAAIQVQPREDLRHLLQIPQFDAGPLRSLDDRQDVRDPGRAAGGVHVLAGRGRRHVEDIVGQGQDIPGDTGRALIMPFVRFRGRCEPLPNRARRNDECIESGLAHQLAGAVDAQPILLLRKVRLQRVPG